MLAGTCILACASFVLKMCRAGTPDGDDAIATGVDGRLQRGGVGKARSFDLPSGAWTSEGEAGALCDCEPFRSSGDADGNRLAGLTAQEVEILAASARGRTVGEVSEALGYPRDTVVSCLAEAIRKLRARSKLEAVLIALRHGLIDVS